MRVIRSAKASAGIDSLRMRGRGRLADAAEGVVIQLESDPEGHRGVGHQYRTDTGDYGWARSVEVAGDVAVVAWEVDAGDVVVLDVRQVR